MMGGMSQRAAMPTGVALPEGPAGVIWRRITSADLPAVHALAAGIGQQDDPRNPPGRPELEQHLSAVDPDLHTALAVVDDRLVAYGIVFAAGSAVRLPGGVLPEARGTGIGRRLLAWQIEAARAVREADSVPISARQPVTADATCQASSRRPIPVPRASGATPPGRRIAEPAGKTIP